MSSKLREAVRKQIFVWKGVWGVKLGVAGKWMCFCDNAISLSTVKNRYLEQSVFMIFEVSV